MNASCFVEGDLTDFGSSSFISEGRIGEISADRTAVIGHRGWCFIYDGSNNYRDAYTCEAVVGTGTRWFSLIESRQGVVQSLGASFLQVIVPNKATILSHLYPEKLGDGITKTLKTLLSAKSHVSLLCPVEELRDPSYAELVFRRNDSHLTIAGNCYFVAAILNALKLSVEISTQVHTVETEHVGDLGSKFATPVSERLQAPCFDDGLLSQAGLIKRREISVAGLNGIQQCFLNESAPLKQSVLVFGNSFFERIPSWGLSPFFAALFREYTFIWSPALDVEEIRRRRPDIVICQTCERFLSTVPEE